MKRLGLISLLAVLMLTIVGWRADADEEVTPLRSMLNQGTFDECGLSKLTPSEQRNLMRMIGSIPHRSFIEDSAIRYLEKKGWEEVHILGVTPTGESSTDYRVLAVHQSQWFTLRPSIVPHPPDPGLYWADISGSHWTLLYPDANEGGFWAEEME